MGDIILYPSLVIPCFPLPPSENQIYMNLPGRGRCATKELKDYKKACSEWYLGADLKIKQAIRSHKLHGHILRIDSQLYFARERIYTKDGRIKKMDVANRLKALHDQICEMIGIDDSQFFEVVIEKRVTEGVREYANNQIFSIFP